MADEIKPGYRTSEFWLAAIAALVGLIIASGVVVEGSTAERIVGLVVAVLSSLGYTVSRTLTKNGGL